MLPMTKVVVSTLYLIVLETGEFLFEQAEAVLSKEISRKISIVESNKWSKNFKVRTLNS